MSHDQCGRWVTVPVMDGMAAISRRQCHLPAGHACPCCAGQVTG